jgi:hypothetical protein
MLCAVSTKHHSKIQFSLSATETYLHGAVEEGHVDNVEDLNAEVIMLKRLLGLVEKRCDGNPNHGFNVLPNVGAATKVANLQRAKMIK